MTNAPDEPPPPERCAAGVAPLGLKIALSIQGFFYFAASGIAGAVTSETFVRLAILAASFAALVAVWWLRRWGLWLMCAVLGFYLLTHVGHLEGAWRGVVLGTLVRTIGIVAAAACWRRLR
jgi:hypothetical protein